MNLLQKASAVAGHGEVCQEREGELLDCAVVGGDPRGQLHDSVHQRATGGALRSWRHTPAESVACWERGEIKTIVSMTLTLCFQ